MDETGSPDGLFYRWKVYERLMREAKPRDKARECFRVQIDGALWVPPPQDGYESEEGEEVAQAAPPRGGREDEDDELYAQRGARAGEAQLRCEDLAEFCTGLRTATRDRSSVKEAMRFALERCDACNQIAQHLDDALHSAAPFGARVARLYACSDILHNSGVAKRGARLYRALLKPLLPGAFYALGKALNASDLGKLRRFSNMTQCWEILGD